MVISGHISAIADGSAILFSNVITFCTGEPYRLKPVNSGNRSTFNALVPVTAIPVAGVLVVTGLFELLTASVVGPTSST